MNRKSVVGAVMMALAIACLPGLASANSSYGPAQIGNLQTVNVTLSSTTVARKLSGSLGSSSKKGSVTLKTGKAGVVQLQQLLGAKFQGANTNAKYVILVKSKNGPSKKITVEVKNGKVKSIKGPRKISFRIKR